MRKMPAVLAEREKAFFSWLSTQLTNHQLSELYTYLPDINLYGMRRSQFTDSLFELEDSEKIQDFLKLLQEDKRFKFMHIAMIRPMVTLIQKYCEYVEYEKKMASGKNVNSTTQQQESEIDQLLVGDDYALLRDELSKHNVTTIEQLKDLNIWVFMNRYGVYGLRKRREISNQIDALLRSPSPSPDNKTTPVSTLPVKEKVSVEVPQSAAQSSVHKSETGNNSRAWSKQETALLIDAYVRIGTNEDFRPTAEKLSKTLRDFAIKSGKTIDETYRNVNGMIMQMGTVQYCFTDGAKGLSNASAQIHEMVDMYKNRPEEFQQILQDAQQLIQGYTVDIEIPKVSNEPQPVSEDNLDKYCLKTKQNILYYGDTPAAALAAYCEPLAQKCPLTMRTLIGKRYNGIGLVVLHSTMPEPGGIKLVSIPAYIQNDLTANTALHYSNGAFSVAM